MKHIIKITLLLVLTLSVACTSKPKEIIAAPDTAQGSTAVNLAEIDGYFLKSKPSSTFVAVLDSANFKETMGVARTMDNKPTEIDFSKNTVGVIAVPATEYETTISIDTASIENRILNVYYSVVVSGDKRTFSILPVNAFTIDNNLEIDSIAFRNGDNTITIAAGK